MAHIRQILANLSISAAEFKKNPKSVIKAVKSEPIAVIINDKPAFYCVPADILESLYSKFYEMNEIQNIQDLDQADHVGATTDDDSSFGVRDIFQTVEDEQNSKLMHSASEDFVDPLSNHIADPLDEEVANQLSYSLRPNAKNGGKRKGPEALGADDLDFDSEIDDLSHPELDPDPVAFEEPNFADIDELELTATPDDLINDSDALVSATDALACGTDALASGTDALASGADALASDADAFACATGASADGNDNLASDAAVLVSGTDASQGNAVVSAEELRDTVPVSITTKSGFTLPTKAARTKAKATRTKAKSERSATKASKPRKKGKSASKSEPAAVDPMAEASPQEQELEERAVISEAINDVSQQIADNNRGIRRLVSGPHSFTLEHVAKTYSPYAQKKIQAKLKKNKPKKNGNKQ